MASATATQSAQRRTVPPPTFAPMMATLVDEPFDDSAWVFEPKFDGLRVLVYYDGRNVRLVSRNDKPQDLMFPDVVSALRKSLRRPMVVDGEIVCFDDK